jgi:LuxR family maltose regulon positive regulatory protein
MAAPIGHGGIPELPARHVQIPRLSRLLDAGTGGPVTLLSAPAGWGKTAALCSWLRPGGVAFPVAWLTVERDDDGTHFWSTLDATVAAIGNLDGQSRPPPAARDPAGLADRVQSLHQPLRLIIDDFHLVEDPTVTDGLAYIIRHSAGSLRLVIATRKDPNLPLHRWRLCEDLTQLRTEELSFTLDETEQLLARHHIELPGSELRALHTRTEGWPGGLQLAALAMRGRADATRLAAEFSGEHETVAQYLHAEVLANLTPQIQDLLLCASVCERVCGELADALTGRLDCHQQLADLHHANVFLLPLEGRPPWYRFHHLFGEMLRAKLRRQPERWRQLHAHAAAWHASHGLPIVALRHALAANDRHLTSTLLRENWPVLALCGGHDGGRLMPSSPWEDTPMPGVVGMTFARAAERLDANDVNAADGLLRTASRRNGSTEGDPSCSVGLAAALRLARARLGDNLAAVLPAAGELLALVERANPGNDVELEIQLATARSIALTTLGTAQLSLGDVQAASESLVEAAAGGGGAGARCPAALSAGGLALVHAVRGDLRHAEQVARAALAVGPCPGQNPCLHCEPAYLALALVHHEWNRAADAARFLDLAGHSRDLSGDNTFAAWSALIRTWHLSAAGNLAAAHAALLDGRRTVAGTSSPHMDRWFAAAEAEIRTACGETHAVPETLTPLLDDVQATSAPVAVALARAYLGDGDIHAAARAVPHWSDETKADPFLAFRLDAGLVEAVIAGRLGDARRAATTLERVLQLAEPDGFRRVFVSGGAPVRELLAEQLEYGTAYWSLVRDLVQAPSLMPSQPQRSPGGPDEPLTKRELTVLRYMQSVLSNEEIASKLFVSVNTVKTHVRNIYRKLNVARRRDAVRRARELHLL